MASAHMEGPSPTTSTLWLSTLEGAKLENMPKVATAIASGTFPPRSPLNVRGECPAQGKP